MPEAAEEEDDSVVLRKLKPKIPDHNDAHPVAKKHENQEGCMIETMETV